MRRGNRKEDREVSDARSGMGWDGWGDRTRVHAEKKRREAMNAANSKRNEVVG